MTIIVVANPDIVIFFLIVVIHPSPSLDQFNMNMLPYIVIITYICEELNKCDQHTLDQVCDSLSKMVKSFAHNLKNCLDKQMNKTR